METRGEVQVYEKIKIKRYEYTKMLDEISSI